METIKGDLILTKDREFKESIRVEGNITGNYNLKVAGDIFVRDIDAGNIDARDIVARDIDARNIFAWNIFVRDIDARDIVASKINAREIVAWNIDAWQIVAREIVARDIEYHAFAIAYRSFKCKSIKGYRNNCFAKCLDGEIEIIDKPKVCDKCGHKIR